MGLLTHYIRDDRGKRVAIVDLFGSGSRRYCDERFKAKDFRRLRRELYCKSNMRWVLGLYTISSIVVFQWISSSMWIRSLGISLRWSMYAAFAMVFALVGVAFVTKLSLGMDARLIRLELLRKRRCASCCYLLDDLEPAEDHCVVCPECSAAWRLKPGSA